MGLSDIDEDDYPSPEVLPGTTTTTMKKSTNLDDLFSDPSPQSDKGSCSGLPLGNSFDPKKVSNDPLDSLFMSSPLNSFPEVNNSTMGEPQKNLIYVDNIDAATYDDANLFDISRPAKHYSFHNPESLLEGFEMQGKKTRPSAATHSTLKYLTRNKDDNKITARLLSLMNYYDVLGVHHDATVEEIRRHYKQKALELHPDRVGRAQSLEEMELFKVITEAHEVLMDPEKRSKYDSELQNEGFTMTSPVRK
ncbi:unnamed protein product [Phytomonas sp. Hart1]|nr:unnamed protein product [Phytomonas sp. Hart1]|eukprot:CCW67078.1 unnamed protein product [Phytomonas sp. isolate Hart1]